jgi:hypothetical protein
MRNAGALTGNDGIYPDTVPPEIFLLPIPGPRSVLLPEPNEGILLSLQLHACTQ